MKKQTQGSMLLDYMKTHKDITRAEAWYKLGISELPKRISELRRSGYRISDEWREVVTRYGKPTRVKAYSLESEVAA